MERPLVLYDGDCGLCCRSVQFVFRHDPRGAFRFAALESDVARRALARHGLPPEATETVVLVEGGRAYTHSTAAVRIARRLAWPAKALAAVGALPRPLRDWGYRLVARNRRRWFGDASSCPAPPPGLRERILG